ncbi:MAG: hypothetical protein Q9193_000133 [Seirophora villosa]
MAATNPLESLLPQPSALAAEHPRFDTTDRDCRRKSSHNFGHLQYRKDSSQAWQSLASSYSVQTDLSRHPEPANIQRVAIEHRGIVVHQYDKEFTPKYIGQRNVVHDALAYGWQVKFANNKISDIFLEEYNAPTWMSGGPEKRPICVIRFKCTGPAECRNATEGLPVSDAKEGSAVGNSADIHGPSAALPLAKLCAGNEDLLGMEIRLAFTKGTMKLRKTGCWLWPMIVSLLMSSSWHVPVPLTEGSKAPLNDWARAVNGRPRETKGAVLREVIWQTSTEWSLKRAPSIFESNYAVAQARPPGPTWRVRSILPVSQSQPSSPAIQSQSNLLAWRSPNNSPATQSQKQAQKDQPTRDSPQAEMEPPVTILQRREGNSIEALRAELNRVEGALAEAVNIRTEADRAVTSAQDTLAASQKMQAGAIRVEQCWSSHWSELRAELAAKEKKEGGQS